MTSPTTMKTSARGVEFLEQEEGVVLRAYRDIAGVWTIGAGLTAASGVVTPVAGMVLTRADASRLLAVALNGNYEPAVRAAMPGAIQYEFDAGVSFHFNTGAISRASWVGQWKARNWPATQKALALWNKAGGKVVAGLVQRREREFLLLKNGYYGTVRARPSAEVSKFARLAAPVTTADLLVAREALVRLGYIVGIDPANIDDAALRKFQLDHALTVDGILGRATLATIRRMVDARDKTRDAGIVVGSGGVSATALDNLTDVLAAQPWIIPALIGAGVLWLGWIAFHYRDAIAAAVQTRLPRVAAYLRSF